MKVDEKYKRDEINEGGGAFPVFILDIQFQ